MSMATPEPLTPEQAAQARSEHPLPNRLQLRRAVVLVSPEDALARLNAARVAYEADANWRTKAAYEDAKDDAHRLGLFHGRCRAAQTQPPTGDEQQ